MKFILLASQMGVLGGYAVDNSGIPADATRNLTTIAFFSTIVGFRLCSLQHRLVCYKDRIIRNYIQHSQHQMPVCSRYQPTE